MTWRRAKGDDYEARALAHLERAGLTLVERNFNTRYGELDLVMLERDTVVFVEVRYRHDAHFGGAVASVTPAKRRRLVRAAGLYLQARPRHAQRPCRFDVLAFADDAGGAQCQWLRNAFDAF